MNLKIVCAAGMGLLAAGLLANQAAFAGTKVKQEIETGFQQRNVDSPEAKFEEYREVPNGPVIRNYRLGMENEKNAVEFEAQNVRQLDQAFDLSISHEYKYRLSASWAQTPHLYSKEARTPYTETDPGVFRLPDQIQTDLQNNLTDAGAVTDTANFKRIFGSFAGGAQWVDLRTRTDRGRVSLKTAPSDHLQWTLGFSQNNKVGKKAEGATFGFSHVVELPVPNDYKTYDMDTGLEYQTNEAQFGIRYGLSLFKNETNALIWDNAKRLTDRADNTSGYVSGSQSSQGRKSLAPDNVAHAISLSGGTKLPWANSRATADLAMGYFRQNERLLPYTINTAIDQGAANSPPFNASDRANLPTENADAAVMTLTQNYAWVSRPVKPLSLGIRFRSYLQSVKTTEVDFPGQVRVDQVWEGAAATNTEFKSKRFSFRKNSMETSADWDIFQPLSAGLKYGIEWMNRDNREVRNSKEHTVTFNTDVKPSAGVLVRGTYVYAKRIIDDFEVDDFKNTAGTFVEAPGLRRFDISDRTRHQTKFLIQLTPGSVNLALNGAVGQDDYNPGKGDLTGGIATNQDKMYGLLENRFAQAGADLDWGVSDRLDLFAFYEYELDRGIQRFNNNGTGAVTQDLANDVDMRTKDRYETASLGADMKAIKERLSLRLAYEIARSFGSLDIIQLGSAQIPKTSPGDTQSQKQTLSLRTDLQASPQVTWELGYAYERYDVSDFATLNIPLVGGENASQTNIFLGDSSRNYRAHIGTLLVKYKW